MKITVMSFIAMLLLAATTVANSWENQLDSVYQNRGTISVYGDTVLDMEITEKISTFDGAAYNCRIVDGVSGSVGAVIISQDSVSGEVIIGGEEFYTLYANDNQLLLKESEARHHICTMDEDEHDIAGRTTRAAENSIFTSPTAPSNLNKLNSRPGAPAVIFLDWDGHILKDTYWLNREFPSNMLPASSVSNDGKYALYLTVVEDFAPLNITITTDSTVYNSYAVGARHRLIITDSHAGSSQTGQNRVGGFQFGSPGFLWAKGFINDYSRGQILTHEIGHSFSLKHDGELPSTTYYIGHGDETVDDSYENGYVQRLWGTNMGDSRRTEVSQFDKNEYSSYKNDGQTTLDDFARLTQWSTIDYMADDHGGTRGTATPLQISSNQIVNGDNIGLIERDTDIDIFTFTTTGGSYDITVSPASYAPNLDIELQLLNSDGTVLKTSNPPSVAVTNVSGTLPAGTYYLRIDGVGYLDPSNRTGYSDYGSRGVYSMSGTIVSDGVTLKEYTISATANSNCSITPSGNVKVYEGSPKTFAITPDAGYQIDSIKVDNGKVTVADSYSFSNVSGDHSIEVWASLAPVKELCDDINSWSAKSYSAFDIVQHNGNIYIASTAANSSQSPASAPWELIGSCNNICGTVPEWSGSVSYSAFESVIYEDTIWVATASIPAGTSANWLFVGECNGEIVAPTEFTITATAYGTATISPSGSSTVSPGGSKSYLIGKSSGAIDSIKINGVKDNDLTRTSYWFMDVASNQTIEVWASEPSVSNTVPVITSTTAQTVNMNEYLALDLLMVTFTDPDVGDSHTLVVLDGDNYTVNGTVVVPNTDFYGTLTVAVQVNDGTDMSVSEDLTIEVQYSTPILAERKQSKSLLVTPNPLPEDESVISIALPASGTYELAIFDAVANKVFEQSGDCSEAVVQWIPRSDLASGQYLGVLKVELPSGDRELFRFAVGIQR